MGRIAGGGTLRGTGRRQQPFPDFANPAASASSAQRVVGRVELVFEPEHPGERQLSRIRCSRAATPAPARPCRARRKMCFLPACNWLLTIKVKMNNLMKTFLKILLASSLAAAAGAKEIKLLNVSYDPTRELVSGLQRRLCQILEGQNRQRRGDLAIARRLRQAGAVRHQRPRGRRGHAGAGLRH